MSADFAAPGLPGQNPMDAVARIVAATAAALPLAGRVETRPVASADQLPAITGQPMVFRGAGWPGTVVIGLTAAAQLPELIAADPGAALKPAVDSGLSTAGSPGPSTVELAPAGSNPFAGTGASAPQLFVVSVDGVDALAMAVREGATYERPSRQAGVDEDFLRNVHRIRGVDMELSVVIGRTTLTIAELLRIKPGQVLELDRAAGAPADVLVNGRHLATGEVVVQDLDFAVKITSIRDDDSEVLG
ncbi:MAG: FliM/FliN family flagellar motor switch protein [Micrococcus sp.]|nr:FliM/FliN family flagellar motor switch protein [Micrococcus sp.]